MQLLKNQIVAGTFYKKLSIKFYGIYVMKLRRFHRLNCVSAFELILA